MQESIQITVIYICKTQHYNCIIYFQVQTTESNNAKQTGASRNVSKYENYNEEERNGNQVLTGNVLNGKCQNPSKQQTIGFIHDETTILTN